MTKDLVLKDVKIVEITSEQYGLLAKMPMNRPITASGVKAMKESVQRNGVLRDVIVVWDKKKNRYLIVDGQHLSEALIELELPVRCRIVECETEAEITQLMIDLNNISKSWKLENYIHGWKESGLKDYRILENASTVVYPDVQVSVIIQAYTQQNRSKATKMVKLGTFSIVDRNRGDFFIDCVSDCATLLPNTRQMNEALIKLMLSEESYDHKRMIKNIKSAVKKGIEFSLTSEKANFMILKRIYEGK
jgi:hypothetical protein